jgi:hypothetical protein
MRRRDGVSPPASWPPTQRAIIKAASVAALLNAATPGGETAPMTSESAGRADAVKLLLERAPPSTLRRRRDR